MNAKLTKVLLTTALTLSAAVHANHAEATPWTFTTSGIIGTGYDTTGTFFDGIANSDLGGLTFTMTTTIDPLGQLEIGPFSYFNITDGNNPIPFSETVSLNHVTKTFSGQVTGSSFSALYIETPGVYGNKFNSAVQDQTGSTVDGSSLSGQQQVFETADSNLGLNFDQVWTYNPQTSDSQYTSFGISGNDANVSFEAIGGTYGSSGSLTSIALNAANVSGTHVPEPGTVALFGVALLVMHVIRRRRNQ